MKRAHSPSVKLKYLKPSSLLTVPSTSSRCTINKIAFINGLVTELSAVSRFKWEEFVNATRHLQTAGLRVTFDILTRQTERHPHLMYML